ncbi:MAG: hypothetical protein CL927_13625 [Deltaproteobacteria bacterium]|nr:hypothetical protein [Deltaproteobacteria bacterium]HCH62074.1 hypothetical protein [Deltaproteobacteria bacterium]
MSSIHRIAVLMGVCLGVGCYLANPEDTASPVSEDDSVSDINGSGTGAVPEGRDVFENNDFTIYWEHYDVWEQGACTRIQLKNEGREVRGWEMVVDLSEDVTSWLDAGGAFMWLVGDQILIEQEDDAGFEPWERASMYYCAEPAVLIEDVVVTFREADDGDGWSGDDSSGDATDADDAPVFTGSESFTTEAGYPVVWTYETYMVSDYACMNITLANGADEALSFISFTTQMSNTTEFVEPVGGAPLVDSSSVLTFVFDDGAVADPGASVGGRVCMTPMARPVGLLDVVVQPSM